jgi:carboxypeptidase Q
MKTALMCAVLFAGAMLGHAQTFPTDDPVIKRIWTEAMDSTQLPLLAHHLLDVIGPRLTGTPQLLKANSWVAEKYKSWGIDATREQYGTWRGWERGTSHIDLLQPRVRTLEGTMLAFSPATGKGGVSARLSILPDMDDSAAFQRWLPSVKGRFVLLSPTQPTGRPDKDWEEFGTKESFDSLKALRERIRLNWEHRVKVTGCKPDSLPVVLEAAGAAGIISSQWSQGWGAYRVFDVRTARIPAVALSLEDYALVYRLTEQGDNPFVRIETEARFLDPQPISNTIGTLRGGSKAGEYVVLSAHLDSWDASSGATDNGTGTIIMLEAMRILKKVYPAPQRTILAGHWASEEQGLNGSRAFVKDHPDIVEHTQALFNQDNGTGRIQQMSGGGLVNAGEHIARWLSRIPAEVTRDLKVGFPGMPAGGGSDNASFAAAGAPGFGLGSLNWNYFAYTWHTNRDTYDKLVFDDLKNNVVLVACLAYLASEDPQSVSRERRMLPVDKASGKPGEWPAVKEPEREGKVKNTRAAQ